VPGVVVEGLRAVLEAAYNDEPFVQVLPDGRWPTTGATIGSNAAQLQAAADEHAGDEHAGDKHAGRAVVVAAIDNLGKGAAGQAVQIANLMLGLPEPAGLTANGVAP
jgi:N-acetyl-gamma-glutamyl-phosphate reductase